MAIFGLFGKKDSKPGPQEQKKGSDKAGSDQPAPPAGKDAVVPARGSRRDPAIANATAKKIDAIESEMSSEFSATRPLPASHTRPGPIAPGLTRPGPASTLGRPGHTLPGAATAAGNPPGFESTLPSIGMSTEFLLGPQAKNTDIMILSSEAAQVIEEAAILFASEQDAMAEQVLRGAIDGDVLGDSAARGWLMLFDLYRLTGRQPEFDALSIEYASKFERSPPSWGGGDDVDGIQPSGTSSSSTPSVAFVGKLDGGIVRLLERLQKLGESQRVLRLEFGRVTDVDPVGCGLLLRILRKLQTSKHELVLGGARELADKIRAILKVGRRDETEAPWLLLLELLRMLDAEKEFEETSIDYCVTFEVSPPAWEAPRSKVTMAESSPAQPAANAFSMPPLVDGRPDQLLAAIAAFANAHDPAVIDCARLRRVDFNAAGQMLSTLAPIAAGGRVIEFLHVNQMVAALFDTIGLKDIARIVVRKD